MMMKLSNAKKGNKGRIVKIDGDKEFKKKVNVMGILEGEEFSVSEVFPMGSPIIINIRNSKIALRKDEAERLTVDIF
ncbi:MAG: ferrous iron transport protein A [Brevinematia bacterium]